MQCVESDEQLTSSKSTEFVTSGFSFMREIFMIFTVWYAIEKVCFQTIHRCVIDPFAQSFIGNKKMKFKFILHDTR